MIENQTTFPAIYAPFTTAELLRAFDAGPARLTQILTGLTEQDLKAHPRAGKWSIQEIVLHLADAEIMGAARIRQTCSQPGCTFAAYDQAVWANTLDYQSRDGAAIQTAFKLFEYLRRSSSAIFHGAQNADWQKTGKHPEYGPLTLRQLLELYADHSERHIAQILDLRILMGKSLDFLLLLKQRLY